MVHVTHEFWDAFLVSFSAFPHFKQSRVTILNYGVSQKQTKKYTNGVCFWKLVWKKIVFIYFKNISHNKSLCGIQ